MRFPLEIQFNFKTYYAPRSYLGLRRETVFSTVWLPLGTLECHRTKVVDNLILSIFSLHSNLKIYQSLPLLGRDNFLSYYFFLDLIGLVSDVCHSLSSLYTICSYFCLWMSFGEYVYSMPILVPQLFIHKLI